MNNRDDNPINPLSFPNSRWDARLGVIYIASSLTLEREWHMALPPSVSFHVSRISLEGDDATNDTLIEMLESGQVERAARERAEEEERRQHQAEREARYQRFASRRWQGGGGGM